MPTSKAPFSAPAHGTYDQPEQVDDVFVDARFAIADLCGVHYDDIRYLHAHADVQNGQEFIYADVRIRLLDGTKTKSTFIYNIAEHKAHEAC